MQKYNIKLTNQINNKYEILLFIKNENLLFIKNQWSNISVYRVFGNNRQIFHGQIERTKLSRKVFYHFVNFPNS